MRCDVETDVPVRFDGYSIKKVIVDDSHGTICKTFLLEKDSPEGKTTPSSRSLSQYLHQLHRKEQKNAN